ncbi:phosphate regulon sensor histidine kinase PhoR [Echinimonas agarilytica]|uniref:Phosphate regulon sensor protein PhoR n=1 Tax=Echinimonas agarilytica TaxID=1215918 RepID=A0AA41W770_9GAMM|nr:phosphate regulon sensor histidine kinase PhoR [Echinimonas agarilytica]MCM2680179.1 phosphate regulon sensor histidine kinase PhoR [Echinimonas agarilytica]
MRERSIGWPTFVALFAVLLLLGLIGWLFNAPLEMIGVGAAGLLFWHYQHMRRLSSYLWRDKRFSPPDGAGSWGVIYDGLYRLQQRNRRRRKDLAKLLKRFRQGAEALPDGAVVISADRTIVWSNQLAQRLLGLRWPEDAGQRIDNLIRHPDFVRYVSNAERSEVMVLPAPGEAMRMVEFRMMQYDNEQILLMVRDVTQWNRMEQMRRDFIANVSHELRTPLTVVQGYIEMLEDPQALPPEMWQKAHGMMLEQTRRMDSLVSQLITLSRIEAAERSDLDHEIDVPSLLNIISEEAKALGAEKAMQITLEVESGLNIKGDLMEMRSAFSNLIFNAVHYTQPEGEIDIRWYSQNGNACFLVSDNGDGIGAEHIQRLTERFYRVDRARSRKTGGSGLGLAIVKHALSHHSSKLKIQSSLTVGSTFSFVIPAELVVKK